jgi:predicted transcriptional regulator
MIKSTIGANSIATMQGLGKLIRKQRRAQEISEQELADNVGVSRATIQRVEAGEYTTSFKMIIEICLILDIKQIKIEG